MAKIIDINEENIDELELFCKKTKKNYLVIKIKSNG